MSLGPLIQGTKGRSAGLHKNPAFLEKRVANQSLHNMKLVLKHIREFTIALPSKVESTMTAANSVGRPMSWGNTQKELSGDYVAGLVQADGSFSAVLVRRGKNNQNYLRLDLKFSIKLRRSEPNKNLLLEISNKFDNKGNLILYKKQNNDIEYQITTQNDYLNVVIPFFMKHHLRGEKLVSFLRFKYIAEILSSKSHVKDKNIFLSLIVIASQLNPSDRLGSKIRYLKPEQQYFVKNNIIPEGVDISKLTESIANFKLNPLSLDFARGCLETNTNNFRNLSKEDQNYIREKFLPPSIEL